MKMSFELHREIFYNINEESWVWTKCVRQLCDYWGANGHIGNSEVEVFIQELTDFLPYLEDRRYMKLSKLIRLIKDYSPYDILFAGG